MAGRVGIAIVSGPEFRRVANRLREIDATLPGKLRRDMKNTVKPLARQAQEKVRTMQVFGGPSRHTGLRRKVARGVRVQAGVGRNPYLRIVTAMPNSNEAVIPRGLDDPVQGWHHPVFGHPPDIVQRASGHWFVETFAHGRDDIRDGLHHVLEDAAQTIARAGRL